MSCVLQVVAGLEQLLSVSVTLGITRKLSMGDRFVKVCFLCSFTASLLMYILHPKAVERNSCEAKSEGLVRYPTTLAPVSGSVNVATECTDNAHTTRTSLNVLW